MTTTAQQQAIFERQAGEVAALRIVVKALLMNHPARESLMQQIAAKAEEVCSQGLQKKLGDGFFEALEITLGALTKE